MIVSEFAHVCMCVCQEDSLAEGDESASVIVSEFAHVCVCVCVCVAGGQLG